MRELEARKCLRLEAGVCTPRISDPAKYEGKVARAAGDSTSADHEAIADGEPKGSPHRSVWPQRAERWAWSRATFYRSSQGHVPGTSSPVANARPGLL